MNAIKQVKISICAIQNNVPKVENKHLIFKTSTAKIKTSLLVDNSSEVKLIDKSFTCTNKLSIFKLERYINLTLGNDKVVQKFTKKALVNIMIGNHSKQMFYSLAKLDAYTVILGDRWLQIHKLAINWKQYTMKFNSMDCMENDYILRSIPCIKFAVGKVS